MSGALPNHRGWRTILFAIGALVSICAGGTAAQQAPASAGPAEPKLIEDLVAASRILADQGLLDG